MQLKRSKGKANKFPDLAVRICKLLSLVTMKLLFLADKNAYTDLQAITLLTRIVGLQVVVIILFIIRLLNFNKNSWIQLSHLEIVMGRKKVQHFSLSKVFLQNLNRFVTGKSFSWYSKKVKIKTINQTGRAEKEWKQTMVCAT